MVSRIKLHRLIHLANSEKANANASAKDIQCKCKSLLVCVTGANLLCKCLSGIQSRSDFLSMHVSVFVSQSVCLTVNLHLLLPVNQSMFICLSDCQCLCQFPVCLHWPVMNYILDSSLSEK